MLNLRVELPDDKLYQVKSAIIYLSRNYDENDSIINEANFDFESVLRAAVVKEKRG